MRMKARRLLRQALLASLVAGSAAEPASGLAGRLKPGVLLFAHPRLGDRNFVESVVVLVVREKGTLGLIINRPTRVPLHEAFPGLRAAGALSLPLYVGGPVETRNTTALLRSPRRIEGARHVAGDVYVTASLDHLAAALARRTPAESVRVYAGHAGWGPGQLEDEVRRGDWVIARGDPEKIFAREPAMIWPEVFDLMKQIQARATAAAGEREPAMH